MEKEQRMWEMGKTIPNFVKDAQDPYFLKLKIFLSTSRVNQMHHRILLTNICVLLRDNTERISVELTAHVIVATRGMHNPSRRTIADEAATCS